MQNQTIKELVESGTEKFVPFQLESDIIPAISKSWTRTPEIKLPSSKILVERISSRGEDTYTMTYFNEVKNAVDAVIVTSDFVMKRLSKEVGEELQKKYMDFLKDNLHHYIYGTATIGCDPEIFIEKGNGDLLPAFNFLNAKPIGHTGAQNDRYWDGFQAEFTVNIPGGCLGYFVDYIRAGILDIFNDMKRHDQDARLSAKTVFDIPIELLRNSKPEHVAFGCNKSFNVYGLKGLEAPGQQVDYRSAGGHLHFGINDKSKANVERIVKALDAVIGVAGVSLFAKYDDPRRRQMYGLAGEYRMPPHGVEYRVLSNAWMFHPLITNIIFDLGRSVVAFGESKYFHYWEASEEEIVKCINNCDADLAKQILKRNEKVLKSLIRVKYGTEIAANFVFDLIIRGMEWRIEDPTNIAKNWDLNGGWIAHCDGLGKQVRTSLVLPDIERKF